MKRTLSLALAAMLSIGLVACAQPGGTGYAGPGEFGLNKTTGGGMLGAAAGGLLGSHIGKGSGRLAATAAGALLGALAGSAVGASLDRADLAYYQQTQQRALETAPQGQILPWHNPQTGASGSFVPTRTYQTSSGQYCREFQQTITVGGKTEEGYGTACRQPDGTWKIIQ